MSIRLHTHTVSPTIPPRSTLNSCPLQPPNAVNFSPPVARSNLFGRVGTHFSPEIELFSSHARNNHLTFYEKSDYENIAIKKFTALGGAVPKKTRKPGLMQRWRGVVALPTRNEGL